MGKKSGSGSGTQIIFPRDRNNFLGLILLCGSEIGDGKNSDPGSGKEKIRIRDKHPGFATVALG
jgi:hypothetical protein